VTLEQGAETSKSIRVLVVDDFERWHAFVSMSLRTHEELQIIGVASDGLQAVQHAEQLQPDLILMDIGLPALNGIEASRRIRDVCPTSKILFVSDNRSPEVAREALRYGHGYVVKWDAGTELLPAVKAVLAGKRFVSTSLAGHGLNEPHDSQVGTLNRDNSATIAPSSAIGARQHQVGFYSDDQHFLDDATRFIKSALKNGDVAIFVATESHQESLLSALQACGMDMGAAINEDRYIQLDAADAIPMFMVNGVLDPVRYLEFFGDLIAATRRAVGGANRRVLVLGECVNLLWAQGNAVAAIQIEKLCNQLIKSHDSDILCAYSLNSVEGRMDNDTFEQICAEHTAICWQ
jgi:DNA-binding NarL/FixJ family response regulator